MNTLWILAIASLCMLLILCLGVLVTAHRTVRTLSRLLDDLILHQDQMKLRGIYAIECVPAQAIYIGSTKVSFHSRWGQHIAILMRGQHDNPRLQQDWNTYGSKAFRFVVVEVIDDPDLIEPRERTIIQHRALYLPPAANYNVHHSRVYGVAPTPELDPAPVSPGSKMRRKPFPIPDEAALATSLELLIFPEETRSRLIRAGLTDSEIAVLEGHDIAPESISHQERSE